MPETDDKPTQAVADWQRPPFEPGNQAALKHGAFSPALVEPRAKELAEATYVAHPHLDLHRDGPAVIRYSMTLARLERLYVWIGDHEEMFTTLTASPQGKGPHGVWDRVERWERAAERAERQLALSPLTRAQLGITTAAAMDLASLWAAEDDNTIDGEAEDA